MVLILNPNLEVSPAARVTAPDFLVLHGKLKVGRIYKREAAINPATQWVWAITGVYDGPELMARSGLTATHEEAMAALKDSWQRWLAWAQLSEPESEFRESPSVAPGDSAETKTEDDDLSGVLREAHLAARG
jgi:hypothetical protein